MGRRAAFGAPVAARFRHHGLPRLGACRAKAQAGGNERVAARNGRGAQFRPVQPRPPDLRRVEADRYRTAVRAALTLTRGAEKSVPCRRIDAVPLLQSLAAL